MTYRVATAMQSFAPAKTFARSEPALRYAQEAARTFHQTYCVWQTGCGLPRLLKRFPAIPKE